MAADDKPGATVPDGGEEQTAGRQPVGEDTAVTQAVAAPEGGRSAAPRRARPPRYRLRFWLAIVLVVLSVLAVIVSAVAVWAHRTVYDTDTYVSTVAPLIRDPAVQRDLSTSITDKVLTASDLQNRITGVLPGRLAFLAGPITAEIGTIMQRELQQFLASPRAEQAWIAINRKGHETLVNVLSGNSKYVTINQDNVTLNLLPLIGVALQRVQARLPDVLGARIQLPQIDPNATPEQARAQLSAALGRPLPADFGTVVLLHGDKGYQIQRALDIFSKLVVVIIVVTIALIVAAIVVSPHRWYTVLELALGVLLAVIITKVIVNQLQTWLLNSIKKQGVATVANSIVTSAIDKLGTFLIWLVVVAVVAAVGAVMATRTAWLDAAGEALARLFHVSADPSVTPSSRARWLAANLYTLRLAGIVVAVVVMMLTPKVWGWLLAVVLALIAYELLLVVWAVGEGVARKSGLVRGAQPEEEPAA